MVARKRFLAAGGGALASAAVLKLPAGAAQFEFKCASSQPHDHPVSVWMTQMWKAVERESGGRIRTQFFPNSELGGDAAMLSQARLGAVQFLVIFWGNLAPIVPVADIGSLGFAYRDAAEGIRIMNGPLGQYLRDETATKGLIAMRECWDTGMYQIGSNSHPIRTPDDLKGFKIRVPQGRITVDLFRAFGGAPTPLSLNETYTGLQTKIIDGESLTLGTIETLRLFEVNKSIAITNHSWAGLWLTANAETWKSIPPDLQEIIQRNNKLYGRREQRDISALNASLADKLGRQGVTVEKVDQAPFRALLRPYYEYWANAFGPTAWGLLQTGLGRKLN